jgi:hypothetical protein
LPRPFGAVVALQADPPIDYVNLSTRGSFLIVAFGAARAKAGYGGICSRFWQLP